MFWMNLLPWLSSPLKTETPYLSEIMVTSTRLCRHVTKNTTLVSIKLFFYPSYVSFIDVKHTYKVFVNCRSMWYIKHKCISYFFFIYWDMYLTFCYLICKQNNCMLKWHIKVTFILKSNVNGHWQWSTNYYMKFVISCKPFAGLTSNFVLDFLVYLLQKLWMEQEFAANGNRLKVM